MAIRSDKGGMMRNILIVCCGVLVWLLAYGAAFGFWQLATIITKALFGDVDGFALFVSNVVVEFVIVLGAVASALTAYVFKIFISNFSKELRKAQSNGQTKRSGKVDSY